jgi:hypothetical protein
MQGKSLTRYWKDGTKFAPKNDVQVSAFASFGVCLVQCKNAPKET